MTAWRRCLALFAVAVTASACAGSSPTASVPREVRIGLLAPLTGANSAAGQDAQRGAQLAADRVNSRNALSPFPNGFLGPGRGAQLKLLTADTAGDPQRAANEVTDLTVQQHAAALVGAYDPESTLTASQRAERIAVPFVNGDTSLDSLTERGLDWFFRTGPSTRDYGTAFFSLLKQQSAQPAARRIVILYSADRTGNDVDVAAQELAKEGQYQTVREVQFDPGASDLSAAVSQVRSANPDVLLFSSSASSATPLLNAFRQLNYQPPAVMAFGTGFSNPGILGGAGTAGRGICRQASWSASLATRNPTARSVADRYQRMFGTAMTEEAANTYTAVITLALAVNDARSVDPARIRSSLSPLNVTGNQLIMPWNGIRFDVTHQNSLAAPVVEQYVGGSFQVVYPRDVASHAVAWPASSAA